MEYCIENACLAVTVTTAGAQVKSVVRKSDGVEHMWHADPAVWGFHAPVLFPYTGRVTGGIIEAKGNTYPAGPHGFARNREHRLLSRSADRLDMELVSSPETMALWPYAFRLRSTFRLEGETLCHTLTVKNLDEEVLRFGIGFHPGFRVPFDSRFSASDYELRFSQEESPICLNCLPDGLIQGDLYYLGANIQSIPLTEELFARDGHCMVGLRSKTLGIYEKGTGRGVVCEIGNFPYCLIWSKPGVPQFVCIEPWMSLPSPANGSCRWKEKPAAAAIEPGACWSTTLRTSFVR